MLIKIFGLFVIIAFCLSVPVYAQQSISLSELKNSKIKDAESKESEKNNKQVSTQLKSDDVDFSEFEKEVFEEINGIRKNPLKYVEYLEEYKKMLNGKILSRPNQPRFMMIEGASAIDEAISDLQSATALRPFLASKLLTIVANTQLDDLKENPQLGHYGKDGSNLRKRLAKVGKSGKLAAENINYRDRIARQVALTMVIDDGVKSRTHRKNILNPELNLLGLSCGVAKGNLMICVLIFTDRFEEIKSSKEIIPVEIL